LTIYPLIVLICCSVGALQAIAVPTGSIRDVVVDTKEGTGIRSVSVRLQSTGRTVVTGDDGRFEIAEVPIGNQVLRKLKVKTQKLKVKVKSRVEKPR